AVPEDRLALMDSVHGAEVATALGPGVFSGVDGLVTQERDLVIVARGADCVPIALVGDDGRTIAVAHCGWQGLTAGIIDAIVDAIARHDSGIAAAVLGPAVCGTCYPVPPDRVAAVATLCSASVAAAALVTCQDGQPGIDVRQGVAARLRERGVPPEAIRLVGGCTVEDRNLFSFRRDGRTGRQGIGIRLGDLARMAT
ncbi:MAG: polyphenol oxidase family protein, partial [Actinobacteria bacterium]|nr:polyphenol oxidase family protein [Actinomycetota bacterium]